MIGGLGDDELYGQDGDDTLEGGEGNDDLAGGFHDDSFVFSGSNDLGQDDIFEFVHQGNDTLDFSGLQVVNGIAVNIAQYGVDQQVGTNGETVVEVHLGSSSGSYREIENVVGSTKDDTIRGNELNNVLRGDAGNDVLDGVSGANELIGGAGDDTYVISDGSPQSLTVVGDEGVDTLDLSSDGITVGVTVDLTSRELLLGLTDVSVGYAGDVQPIDIVIGTGHADTLIGDEQANELWGGDGDDTLIGGGGSDVLLGQAGFDNPEIVDDANVVDADPNLTFTSNGSLWRSIEDSDAGFNLGQLVADSTASSATNTATWTFSGLEPNSEFYVYTTWTPDLTDLASGVTDGSSTVTYEVTSNGATTPLGSVDQSIVPAGPETHGRVWHPLVSGSDSERFIVGANGELSVQLSTNGAEGRVYADAIRIEKFNQAPTLVITDQTVDVDNNTDWSFSILAEDPDGSDAGLTFALGDNKPSELSLIPGIDGAATIVWTAGRPEGGFPVTVYVTDSGNPGKKTATTFTVHSGNGSYQPPVIGTTALINVQAKTSDGDANLSVNEDDEILFRLSASDPSGTGLTWSLGPGAPTGTFVHPVTGDFSWTPGELDDSSTPYSIELRVTNHAQPPIRITHTVNITVDEVDTAPVFDSDPAIFNPDSVSQVVTGLISNDGDVNNVEVLVDVQTVPDVGSSEFTYSYLASIEVSDEHPG